MSAIKELLSQIKDLKSILCAEIEVREHQGFKVRSNYLENPLISIKEVDDYDDGNIKIRLFPGYTDQDLENFTAAMDFEYDSGYGGQNLFGLIWMKDGTWLSRGEYDGSEWWNWNRLPELPTDFQRALNIETIIGKETI
jgi:hypothetical protein